MEFFELFDRRNWVNCRERIYSASSKQVEEALGRKAELSLDDLAALLSPAASRYIAAMAELSNRLCRQRFGNTIQMYVPLYVSNECQNICTYCGFSMHNKIARITLTPEQIEKEVAVIKAMGFQHVLIVSGESKTKVGLDYFISVLDLLKRHFSHLSLEVQPLEQFEYERLIEHGLNTVLVYQETYNKEKYREHHPKGRKANFDYRLQTPDRLGRAGIHKIGLGVLLGLEDWRTDAWFTGLHLSYLRSVYWKTKFSISFPRLRPAVGVSNPQDFMSDRDLVQLICAYRIFDPNIELSLSTRESAKFRDHALKLGITHISAGSSTEPGGYSQPKSALAQFEICDQRSPEEMAAIISAQGYEAVWKDWDRALQ